MSEVFALKKGDRQPVLAVALSQGNGSAIPGIDDAVVRFRMRLESADEGDYKVDAVATVASGVATYAWADGDTDTIGRYLGEFVVTFEDGTEETIPGDDYIPIRIGARL